MSEDKQEDTIKSYVETGDEKARKKILLDISKIAEKSEGDTEIEVNADQELQNLQAENESLKSALSVIAEKELAAKCKKYGVPEDLSDEAKIELVKRKEAEELAKIGNEPAKASPSVVTWDQNVGGVRQQTSEKEYDTESLLDMMELKKDMERLKNEGKISQEEYQNWWRNVVKSGIKKSREEGTEFEISTVEEKDDKGRPYKRLTAKMVPKTED